MELQLNACFVVIVYW